jgi:uncharacterized repeat protein (TIGR03803 family)
MRNLLLCCAALLVADSAPALAGKAHEIVIHTFTGGTDGAQPNSALTLGGTGLLYGTTVNGGGAAACSSGCGTVFQLSGSGRKWAETVLYAFQGGSDGEQPFNAALALGPDGSLYGETLFGGAGNGTVFKLSPPSSGGNWTETILYSFQGGKDGAVPESNILLAADGTLYGTTYQGGTGCGSTGCGTAFSLTPPTSGPSPWTHAVLYRFRGKNDGATPIGGVIAGSGGVLYGTTTAGGSAGCGGEGCGTVFALTPNIGSNGYTETILYDFKKKPEGLSVYNTLLLDSSGNLYGSTSNGGKGSCGGGPLTGCGTDFELTPPAGGVGQWQQSVIHAFIGKKPGGLYDGSYPNGALIAGAGGVLYGSTYGGGYACPVCAGTVYQLAPPTGGGTTWTETLLYPFQAGDDGSGPQGGLVADSGGQLFGITSGGGSANLGIAFMVTP